MLSVNRIDLPLRKQMQCRCLHLQGADCASARATVCEAQLRGPWPARLDQKVNAKDLRLVDDERGVVAPYLQRSLHWDCQVQHPALTLHERPKS